MVTLVAVDPPRNIFDIVGSLKPFLGGCAGRLFLGLDPGFSSSLSVFLVKEFCGLYSKENAKCVKFAGPKALQKNTRWIKSNVFFVHGWFTVFLAPLQYDQLNLF